MCFARALYARRRSYKTSRDRANWLSVILNILATRTYLIGTYAWLILLSSSVSSCRAWNFQTFRTFVLFWYPRVSSGWFVKAAFMSQLVPYHIISSEQDDSLMFATMFDYQMDDYNKPKVSLWCSWFIIVAQCWFWTSGSVGSTSVTRSENNFLNLYLYDVLCTSKIKFFLLYLLVLSYFERKTNLNLVYLNYYFA